MLKNMNRIEAVVALVIVAFLVVGCLTVLRPFMSAILWAAVLAYSTWPVLLRVDGWMGGRRTLAAYTLTAIVAIVLVLPFVVAGFTLAGNVSRLEDLSRYLQGGLPSEAPEWLRGLPVVGSNVERAWPEFAQDTEKVSDSLKAAGVWIGKWFLANSLNFGRGILQLVLSLFVVFVFYRDGERMIARIATGAHRIGGDVSQHLLSIAGSTVRTVVYGIIGAALAQAVMAGIGFRVAGIPSPFLLGLLTFILALIPAGPPVVWVPAALWLFHQGHFGWGVFMLAWGFFVISGIDNLVRPYLISRGSNLPFVVVLLGALGGVFAFGFIGLFLGPVLLAVGYALLREFTAKRRPQGDEAAASDIPAAATGGQPD